MSEVILDKDFKYIEFREKITELEKEIELLKVKLNKESREKIKLEEKNKSLAHRLNKLKTGSSVREAEKYRKMKPHYEKFKEKVSLYKRLQHEKTIEIEFYKKRIKECFGMEGYKRVMLHKDMPRQDAGSFKRINELEG